MRMSEAPRGALLRELKGRAQRLDPVVWVGKAGASDAFYAALDQALKDHELVKVKFDGFKDQKKVMSPEIAERSGSHIIMRVGNVLVLYRANEADEEQDYGDE
jgi:RNA-binding protein